MNFPITENHMTLLGFIYQLDMHPLHLTYTLSPLLLATKLKQVDNTDLKKQCKYRHKTSHSNTKAKH